MSTGVAALLRSRRTASARQLVDRRCSRSADSLTVPERLGSAGAAREVILTGDRPTGPLHLGHYTGSLASRVRLQREYETYILIADLQALTDNAQRPDVVARAIHEVLLDNLSVGLDPEVVTFVLQSGVPKLAELAQIYLNLVTVARLQRNPTVKEEMREKGFGADVPAGFLCYPVSQAADITGFGAELVPVGQDQVPVIEQTREIVRRFNRLYGETLVMPEALLVGPGARLPGTDGRAKMSTSLGNAINLSDPPEVVREKVAAMYTDPTRMRATDPGHVKGNPVFAYLDAFDEDEARVAELKEWYRAGRVGDVEVKRRLVEVLERFLMPIRERRAGYEQRPEEVREILASGTERGRGVVAETLDEVRDAIGLPRPAVARR
jgi:tryptophanyl-tRNA synthetase